MIIQLIAGVATLGFCIGYFITRHKINKINEQLAMRELERQRLIKLASIYGGTSQKDKDSE